MIQQDQIPLSLYVHIPWCERKCPYCDFNSHEGFQTDYQGAYVDALLLDLQSQLQWVGHRRLASIFIGGGTPSLFSGPFIGRLLDGIACQIALAPEAEITLESNPGSAERDRYRDYFNAGVNRLSIGVQSFDDRALQALGRIHSGADTRRAIDLAASAGFSRWNLDLMHGLPGQSTDQAIADISEAIALSNGHLSWYQLTIERNTRFWSDTPELPDEDTLEDIQRAGEGLLAEAGLLQYEVSAYARTGQASQHNLNYWSFGDYLGIGAGAHGKVTTDEGAILRTQRTRSPTDYLTQMASAPAAAPKGAPVSEQQLVGEFVMNALRLREGCRLELFSERTGRPLADLTAAATRAVEAGWLEPLEPGSLCTTALGYRHLDTVVAAFL